MVYVTTTILAEGSWVWLITLWLTKRRNDLLVILQVAQAYSIVLQRHVLIIY
jgi:hypothetical protein